MTSNQPKAAPTHEEMRNYAVGSLQLMPYMLDATLSYVAACESKDDRIAELEREVAELRKQVPQADNWLEEDQQG